MIWFDKFDLIFALLLHIQNYMLPIALQAYSLLLVNILPACKMKCCLTRPWINTFTFSILCQSYQSSMSVQALIMCKSQSNTRFCTDRDKMEGTWSFRCNLFIIVNPAVQTFFCYSSHTNNHTFPLPVWQTLNTYYPFKTVVSWVTLTVMYALCQNWCI